MRQNTAFTIEPGDEIRLVSLNESRPMGLESSPGAMFKATAHINIATDIVMFVESADAAQALIDALTKARDFLAAHEPASAEAAA